MRMHVDEARRHDQTRGINGAVRLARNATNLHDAVPLDSDVAVEPRVSRPIHDPSVADDEIVFRGGGASAGGVQKSDEAEPQSAMEPIFHGHRTACAGIARFDKGVLVECGSPLPLFVSRTGAPKAPVLSSPPVLALSYSAIPKRQRAGALQALADWRRPRRARS